MNKVLFSVLLLLVFSRSNPAQQDYSDSVYSESFSLDNKKFISAASISGIYIGTIYDSYVTWWKDNKRPFTLKSSEWFDKEGDNGIDKFGHFYTSYVFYKIQKNFFLWGGYDPGDAKIFSGALTGLMALIIEVGDGFSRYGFCYKDFLSNAGGLTYAILQDEFPFLQNINFKWSYFPSEGYSFPPKFSSHYEGHIYWITFNTMGMINWFSGSNLPEYIQPAFGYSINKNLQREYFVGLDINLLPLFNTENTLVNYFGEIINLLHIPTPGVKIMDDRSPEYRLFLLR